MPGLFGLGYGIDGGWGYGGTSTAAAFTPSSVAGQLLWLKADGTLWQESTRTTPAVADADVVGAWDDASGNGKNALQATAGSRPLLKLSIMNGRSVIRFDGTDDRLDIAVFAPAQPGTVFVVADINGAGRQQLLDDTDCSGRWVMGKGVGGNAALFGINAGTTLEAAHTSGAPHIYEATFNGATSEVLIDGVSLVAGDANTNASTELRIGSGCDTTLPLNGDIAEILIYDTSLSAGNRTSIRSYLQTRWGTP